MEIVELSSYTEFEKVNIAYEHLIPKELARHGLKPEQFSIDHDAMTSIIEHYTREAGVRELDRLIATLIRKSIKEILVEKRPQ